MVQSLKAQHNRNGGKFKPEKKRACEESTKLQETGFRSKKATLKENCPCTTSDDNTTLDR